MEDSCPGSACEKAFTSHLQTPPSNMATGDKSKMQSSWHDTSWIPVLNQYNVMEYFSQRSNPFYDRTCNNEIIRMQRADSSQLALVDHESNVVTCTI